MEVTEKVFLLACQGNQHSHYVLTCGFPDLRDDLFLSGQAQQIQRAMQQRRCAC
jgi:hypothetical protein